MREISACFAFTALFIRDNSLSLSARSSFLSATFFRISVREFNAEKLFLEFSFNCLSINAISRSRAAFLLSCALMS